MAKVDIAYCQVGFRGGQRFYFSVIPRESLIRKHPFDLQSFRA